MSLRHFEFLEKIGDGAFSTVWKVKRYSDSLIYALKKVRMSRLNQKEKRNALNEVKFLSSISSPYVIAYRDAFFDEDSESLCILMEYASGGDLLQLVQKGKPLEESFIWQVLISVVQGLKALHDSHIMHRDLKTANVFMFKNFTVKIGDMNVAKVVQDGMLNTQTGTPYYASPEIWKDAPYNTQSDIWSLGCVLYEAAALFPPFRAEDMQGLFKKVVKGQFQELPRKYSDELKSVISLMLQVNPRLRPSCDQILRMPVVRDRMTNKSLSKHASTGILDQDFRAIRDRMHHQAHRSNYRERINQGESRSFHTKGSKSDLPNLSPLKLPGIFKPGVFKHERLKPRLIHPAWWG